MQESSTSIWKIAAGVFVGIIILPAVTCGGCLMLGSIGQMSDGPTVSSGDKTEDAPPLEVTDLSTKITESNNVWSKFAYQVELTNDSNQTYSPNLTVQFIDSEGYVVDTASHYGVTVKPGETRTLNDHTLIDASVADTVDGIEVKEGL